MATMRGKRGTRPTAGVGGLAAGRATCRADLRRSQAEVIVVAGRVSAPAPRGVHTGEPGG